MRSIEEPAVTEQNDEQSEDDDSYVENENVDDVESEGRAKEEPVPSSVDATSEQPRGLGWLHISIQ